MSGDQVGILRSVFSDCALKETISLYANEKSVCVSSIPYEKFVNISFDASTGVSEDEIRTNIGGDFRFSDLLSSITQIADDLIEFRSDSVFVKPGRMIEWKDLTEVLGEDIFVCALISEKTKMVEGNELFSNVDWPYSLSSGDRRIGNCLAKGVSENHLHLNGSGPSFYINWFVLNNSTNISRYFDKSHREDFLSEWPAKDFTSFENDCLLASCLRLAVFIFVSDMLPGHEGFLDEEEKAPHYLKGLCSDYLERSVPLSNSINYHKFFVPIRQSIIARSKITNPSSAYGKGNDYASSLLSANANESIETGERVLLLKAFSVFDKMRDNYKAILYIYLGLKQKIASYFYQTNDKLGFANFSHYQKMNDFFYKNTNHKNDNPKYLVKWMMQTKTLINGEIRIAPKNGLVDQKIDVMEKISVIRESEQSISDKQHLEIPKDRFYFVPHFIKTKEKRSKATLEFTDKPRNNDLREKTIRQAKSISHLLSSNTITEDKKTNDINFYAYHKILRGIDAANSERNARPEVFGPAYRVLKNYWYTNSWDGRLEKAPLGYTYHVGEDFCGIINGLRAIDEAIHFLCLSNGDRLGHCVALGISAKDYVRFKSNKVIKTKQEALDDYVWALHYLTVGGYKNLAVIAKIQDNAEILRKDIYGSDGDLNDYFLSMALRSDYPKVYFDLDMDEGSSKLIDHCKSHDKPWLINRGDQLWEKAKDNRNAITSFKRYEFDTEVRNRGDKGISVELPSEYVEICEFLQNVVKKEILVKGLSIETNPTSNYLIGPFTDYSALPIFSFNSYGINDGNQLDLPISVCTDDQGIFRTSLAGEYSIVYEILTSEKNGIFKNNHESAYRYIDYLRQLSNDVSFGDNR